MLQFCRRCGAVLYEGKAHICNATGIKYEV